VGAAGLGVAAAAAAAEEEEGAAAAAAAVAVARDSAVASVAEEAMGECWLRM